MFCREHVVQLHRESEKFRAAGAELVVIGSGKAHWVAGFREETGYDGKILVDPDLVSYKAAELKRGAMTVFNPATLFRGARTVAHGFKQGRTQGDPWQQGGVLVIDRSGTIRFTHRSGGAGDNAAPAKVLAALPAA